MEDFRAQLEELNPNVTLSVELPHNGNGNLFQARTTISDGLIFYGRADSEEEAILKCCQKAVKHLVKNQEIASLNNNNVAPKKSSGRNESSSKRSNGRRRNNHIYEEDCRWYDAQFPKDSKSETRPPYRKSELNKREIELRSEMGDVLDRVAQWNSRYYTTNKRQVLLLYNL